MRKSLRAKPRHLYVAAKQPLRLGLALSLVLGLFVGLGISATTTTFSGDVAHAAISCPTGSTLVTVNSTNYCSVNYTSGTSTFTIPAGVTSITAILTGGQGVESYNTSDATVANVYAHASGGKGAKIQVTRQVSAGETLTLETSLRGGAGGNGRCNPLLNLGYNAGGGYSKLSVSGGTDQVIAGGGGGGGCSGATFPTQSYALTQLGGAGGNAGLPAINNGAAAAPATNGGNTLVGSASPSIFGGSAGTTSASGTGGTGLLGTGGSGISMAGGAGGGVGVFSSGGGGGSGCFGGGGGGASGYSPGGAGGGGGSSCVSGFTVTAASLNSATPNTLASLAGSIQVLFQVTFPLNFDTQGGSSEAAQTFWPGTSVTLPAAPTKLGFNFTGWYSASNGGTLAGTAGAAFSPAGSNSVTLYAQWNADNYSVTFDAQGGSNVSNGNYTYDSGMTLPTAPTRNGYTFIGWFSSPTGGTALASPYNPLATTPFTLYAQWTPNSYAVTFDTQGGSTVNPVAYVYGASITLPSAPTLPGNTFQGWYSATSGGILLGAAGSTITPTNGGSQTIYAQWVADAPPPSTSPVTNSPTQTVAVASAASVLSYTGTQTGPVLLIGGTALVTGLGLTSIRYAVRRRQRG